jgi:hypothetical protein
MTMTVAPAFLRCSRKWRKIEVTRLFVNGVAFPAEVAEFGVWKFRGEQGFEMAGVLGGGDIGASDEGDHIVTLQWESRGLGTRGGVEFVIQASLKRTCLMDLAAGSPSMSLGKIGRAEVMAVGRVNPAVARLNHARIMKLIVGVFGFFEITFPFPGFAFVIGDLDG